MRKMRVAIIGQGRSGWEIHGKYFASEQNTNIEVAYVVDALAVRREKAAEIFGCPVFADYTALYDKKDIDLVVNASFSQMHYPITKDLLEHGFNVLVEKPFGRTYYECADLMRTAREHGVTVAAFHQTLCTPSFLTLKEIMESGKLGDIFQISLRYSGFARRWDWQTLQSCVAGSVFNSGPHPIGQALAFLSWDPATRVEFCDLRTVLTSGDAEDYGKIILSAPGKPTVDIEICSADAYSDFVFKIYGKYGTLKASNDNYEMKYVDPAELVPRPVIRESLVGEGGKPMFCKETLPIREEKGAFGGTAFGAAVKNFYDMLYESIMNGAPLTITPEMAAEVIRVIEICHAQKPLPVKYE